MQTASQIMAAKRAAKQKLKAKRETDSKIGDGRVKGDRNKAALVEHRQRQVRDALLYGEIVDRDTRLTADVRHWFAIDDLVYGRNRNRALAVFEKLGLAMRVVSALYNDKELHSTCCQAQKALEDRRELSPNAMRILLQPVMRLADYCTAYSEILPAATYAKIANYCTAVRVVQYTAALFDAPHGVLTRMLDVIRGTSLTQSAKDSGLKQNELRMQILDAAWDFYRVVECFISSTPEPKGIPDLRHPAYVEFADRDFFDTQIKLTVRRLLIPFESATGISLLNYAEFKEKLINIETRQGVPENGNQKR